MQNDVDAATREPARARIANVRLDEPVPAPPFAAHLRADVVEVAAVAGGEIVESDDRLIELTRCEPMNPALPVTSQRSGFAINRSRAISIAVIAGVRVTGARPSRRWR